MNLQTQELMYIATAQSALLRSQRKSRQRRAINPVVTPPEGSREFDYVNNAAAAGTTGTTVAILSFKCPFGWDGVAKKILFKYTGSNFIEGSGQLFWGFAVDGAFVMNYENAKISMGDLQGGRDILGGGVVFKSAQTLTLQVIVGAAFVPDANSQFIGGLTGYFYPRGVARAEY